MLAYLNDPLVKENALAKMAGHRKADELVQGYGYWSDGNGCAVGCLIESLARRIWPPPGPPPGTLMSRWQIFSSSAYLKRRSPRMR